MRVVGLISGTSMDGIDVACADLMLRDDTIELTPIGAFTSPFDKELRRRLEAALPPATTSSEEICRLDTEVGQAFASAARRALSEIDAGAELAVSHGQTLYHLVEEGRARGTLQIGEAAWIAEETGLAVVADLRTADVAAGGQGAPLAPIFDVLLLGGTDGVRAALNIGGIANLTVVSPEAEPVAFDIGPGNALIDAVVAGQSNGRQAFDADGELARRGNVHAELLDRLLADPYYRANPPKTTGKEHFHLTYLTDATSGFDAIGVEDLVATVTMLTARTIADACRYLKVEEVVVSGGGVHNPVLMEMIKADLTGVSIRSIDELGVPASFKEAYFIALIGFLTVHNLAGNVPSATGASRPVVLGSLRPARNGFALPPPATVAPTRLQIAGLRR